MAIRAAVFDIGDVLEIAPDLGVRRRWETRLGFAEGEIGRRTADIWAAGAIGAVTEDEVYRAISDRLNVGGEQADAFMSGHRVLARGRHEQTGSADLRAHL